MSSRFTRDGSAALEQHLHAVCEQVHSGIRSLVPAHRLEGIALAGGYGRGEGGVLRTESGDQPYNDLEFFVLMRGSPWLNDRRYKQLLHELGERLTPLAGIEVEFKIISSKVLQRAQPSMFYYDLVLGHRWLLGDDRLMDNAAHHRDASRIPLYEVTRLLFNRCSGLLFAKARLQQSQFSAEDAVVVARNIAKAQLALGDAWLAARGLYHWSCLERHQSLAAGEDLHRHHAQGVEFKLHPHRSTLSREELARLHADVSSLAQRQFLSLESQRLRQSFADPSAYLASRINKCPEQPVWKNILQHVRSPHVALGIPQPIERHPREALLNALVLMLWIQPTVQRERLQAYTKLWHCFN